MTVTVSSWVGRGGPTASSGEGARHLGGSLCVPGLPAAALALRLCPVRAPSPEAAACLGVSPHFSSHQGPGGCEAWAEVDLWVVGGGAGVGTSAVVPTSLHTPCACCALRGAGRCRPGALSPPQTQLQAASLSSAGRGGSASGRRRLGGLWLDPDVSTRAARCWDEVAPAPGCWPSWARSAPWNRPSARPAGSGEFSGLVHSPLISIN